MSFLASLHLFWLLRLLLESTMQLIPEYRHIRVLQILSILNNHQVHTGQTAYVALRAHNSAGTIFSPSLRSAFLGETIVYHRTPAASSILMVDRYDEGTNKLRLFNPLFRGCRGLINLMSISSPHPGPIPARSNFLSGR